MYRLLKSLNNNVALVKDEQGQQAVVMGLGIIHNKKKGDIIPDARIEKLFSLKNEESKESFLLLLRDMPLDFIKVSYDLIDNLTEEYHYPVQDYLYITLTDHIFCSYQSLKEGRYQRSQLPNLSETYPIEYDMAQKAVTILRRNISEDFPDDEIDRIALHFLNAKGEELGASHQDKENKKDIIQSVEVVLHQAGVKRNRHNQNFYDRFMIHLTYLINRLCEEGTTDAGFLDSTLEAHVKEHYRQAYDLAREVLRTIEESLHTKATQEETFYLTIHISRLL
ncbi:PRD domain-containing protein [Streptococcus hyovaginalis]|uniref:PRD domain-containing protein n=1 Tax=Streptococcus hyovaginalis TaxID=149015 RepID=UPI0014789BEB|nr:PRD domain-containing protein [Streptococcus hyovaginalis]